MPDASDEPSPDTDKRPNATRAHGLALARVFYVSAIVEPLSAVDVQVILGAAQVNNRRLDVTGLLGQSDGHFAQVLEGRREVIVALMHRVARDARHKDVRVLLEESITRRQFERWSMHLVRRDDMADEMRQLHEGLIADPALVKETIARLLAASA